MAEQRIENSICEVLTGDEQKNALKFVDYLRTREMLFERCGGYWESKLYWVIKYRDQSVCYILVNGSQDKTEPWIIWSDDSGSDWFADIPVEEHIKEIAWKNVDLCASCGGDCSPGMRKKIFGKEFNHVCRTPMRFINPNEEALDCVIKMVAIRKDDILGKIQSHDINCMEMGGGSHGQAH